MDCIACSLTPYVCHSSQIPPLDISQNPQNLIAAQKNSPSSRFSTWITIQFKNVNNCIFGYSSLLSHFLRPASAGSKIFNYSNNIYLNNVHLICSEEWVFPGIHIPGNWRICSSMRVRLWDSLNYRDWLQHGDVSREDGAQVSAPKKEEASSLRARSARASAFRVPVATGLSLSVSAFVHTSAWDVQQRAFCRATTAHPGWEASW